MSSAIGKLWIAKLHEQRYWKIWRSPNAWAAHLEKLRIAKLHEQLEKTEDRLITWAALLEKLTIIKLHKQRYWKIWRSQIHEQRIWKSWGPLNYMSKAIGKYEDHQMHARAALLEKVMIAKLHQQSHWKMWRLPICRPLNYPRKW